MNEPIDCKFKALKYKFKGCKNINIFKLPIKKQFQWVNSQMKYESIANLKHLIFLKRLKGCINSNKKNKCQ